MIALLFLCLEKLKKWSTTRIKISKKESSGIEKSKKNDFLKFNLLSKLKN